MIVKVSMQGVCTSNILLLQIIIICLHLGLLGKFFLTYCMFQDSTYTAGICLTQNFELKVLSLAYISDWLVHHNLWYVCIYIYIYIYIYIDCINCSDKWMNQYCAILMAYFHFFLSVCLPVWLESLMSRCHQKVEDWLLYCIWKKFQKYLSRQNEKKIHCFIHIYIYIYSLWIKMASINGVSHYH